jgi:hypothetical protein
MKSAKIIVALAGLMLAASVMPAGATGMYVRDFKRLQADPQYEDLLTGYIEGLIEGEIMGAVGESAAWGGTIEKPKLFCFDPADHYGGKEGLKDVRAYLSKNADVPENVKVGAVILVILRDRYPCG